MSMSDLYFLMYNLLCINCATGGIKLLFSGFVVPKLDFHKVSYVFCRPSSRTVIVH